MAKNRSITTKTGDSGMTSLLDGRRVDKHHLRPEAFGSMDEACAFIGLARSVIGEAEITSALLKIQHHIFLINAELACPRDSLTLLTSRIQSFHLQELEQYSEKMEKEIQLREFIIYGQSTASAYLDVARTVVRRAERRVIELHRAEALNNEIIPAYLNRLSDVLFLLARYIEIRQNREFIFPEKR